VNDAPFILDLLNTEGWLKYIGEKGVRDLEQAEHYIEIGPIEAYKSPGNGLMLLLNKTTGEYLGICGLLRRDYLDHPDIGYALMPRFEKNGYITEACTAILTWHKTYKKLSKIYAVVLPSNERSIKLLMTMEFKYKESMEREGEVINLYEKFL